MHLKQKIVFIIGTLIIVGTGIYPTWVEEEEFKGVKIKIVYKHFLIFNPPVDDKFLMGDDPITWTYHLDYSLLMLEWAIIALITLAIIVLLKKKHYNE